jgi:23S rRNA (cytidine1920-2'-O)/16S rRNA (cytidine1409-2'-O)-methyltransferase
MPLNTISQPVDLVTIDVSFISLRIVIPAVIKFMNRASGILALIKPQFEVGRDKVGKGGIVRNPAHHDAVIEELTVFVSKSGLICESVVQSAILGAKGNREFFISIKYPG